MSIKNKIVRLIAMTMAFVMVMALAGCVQKPPVPEQKTYTVCVMNGAMKSLEKCKVEIYSDDSLTALIYTGITDKNGQVSFTETESDTYVAVISKVHAGYDVAQYYPLTGERTQIVLKPGALTDADMDSVHYSLGDPVMDFSVMTSSILGFSFTFPFSRVVITRSEVICDPLKKRLASDMAMTPATRLMTFSSSSYFAGSRTTTHKRYLLS